jgi:hypothetical protein
MKTIKFIQKTNVILLVSISLISCTKPREIRIDQESKDYCSFDIGSYWIYQDSASLKTDYVVISKPIGCNYEERGIYKYEKYCFDIYSYSQDTTYFFNAILTTEEAVSRRLKPCLLTKGAFKYPYYHNGEIGEDFWSLILSEKRNDYTLNDVTYSDIKIFENNYLEEKKIYYWSKYVGLIREEIYKNDSLISVKNLIKYNVKPYNQ